METGFLTLKSVDEILKIIESFAGLTEETVKLTEAQGRTLANDFLSPEDLPGFSRSTVDGFAVRAQDVFGASEGAPALLDYLGECPMGAAPSLIIEPGTTARIWTGGMLPQGGDAVVMLEYARLVGGTPANPRQVELTKPAAPFDNMIQKGEDAAFGESLINKGAILRAQELGLLAALGQEAVKVSRKPKVAVISSGDEVVTIQETPAPGQVRDINSYTLGALAHSLGAEAQAFGLVGDDQNQLRNMVNEALTWADVVLLSGGSSVGQRDFTLKILAELPNSEILAHGVAISPGKPLILAKVGSKSLWGLPGHAASALICAEVFIRPLIKTLLGQPKPPAHRTGQLKAVLTRPVASAQGRRDYIRVALEAPTEPGGPLRARPVLGKSGLISTLVKAEALIVCPEDQEGLAAGELVGLEPLT